MFMYALLDEGSGMSMLSFYTSTFPLRTVD